MEKNKSRVRVAKAGENDDKKEQFEIPELEEFVCELEEFPMDPTIVSFGMRRTGKSTSIKNILPILLRDIPFGIVMSNTAFTGSWDGILPPWLIFQG